MKCISCRAELADGARFCGACGSAQSPTESSPGAAISTPADLIGREIAGRYRMLAKLGEGGMGAVYRAEQISLKRKVAVKLLRPELSAQPGLVRRFNAEAELAAQLSHPNTVGIYDFGQDTDGTLYIAMEYVEGKSLRGALAEAGALPAARAVGIAAQIASSLADAHARGIVHRDLKPDNVMLTERGKHKDVVRVLDFGIAKLWEDGKGVESAMTRAGDLVGTPQYMAPEQIRADAVDGRTDVYALGALLYEMVTGRLPFEGATLMAILSRHLTETAEPPSRRRPDLAIPPALDELIMTAMAKRPDDRIPSMERFGEQLVALASSLGAPVVPLGTPSGPSTAQHVPATGFPGGPPTSRPAGRPPGVPQTFPPGMMVAPSSPPPMGPAPTSSPAPYVAQTPAPLPIASPPPGVMPIPTPPPHHALPPPPRRGMSKGLVLVLAGVGAAAIAAAVAVLVIKSRKNEASEPGETPSARTGPGADEEDGDDDDHWDGESDEATEPDTQTRAAGELKRVPAGWGLIVPPGMETKIDSDGNSIGAWASDFSVAIAIGPIEGTSASDLDSLTAAFVKDTKGKLVGKAMAPINGVSRPRAIVKSADGKQAMDAVAFIGPSYRFVAVIFVPFSEIESTMDARDQVFAQNVVLPGDP